METRLVLFLVFLNFIYFLICSINAATQNEGHANSTWSIPQFTSHFAPTPEDCALSCFARSICVSYIYKQSNTTCHLFQENPNEDEKQQTDDFIYGNISKWPPSFAKGCHKQPCQPDEYCVSYDVSSYVCLKLAVNCGAPKKVHNAEQVSVTNLTYKGEVVYKCAEGFKPKGKKSISFCQSNSEWSEVNLRCKPVNCGAPKKVPNAVQVSKTNQTYKGEVVYKCDKGFQPKGNKSISFCQSNSEWSKVNLVCKHINSFPGLQ